jgi:DNA repair protein RadD
MFREWVCLDHPGRAGKIAAQWWWDRFGNEKPGWATVNTALEDMFLGQKLLDWTKTITVHRNGKYFEIVAYNQPIAEPKA